jgi:hypothetical protein
VGIQFADNIASCHLSLEVVTTFVDLYLTRVVNPPFVKMTMIVQQPTIRVNRRRDVRQRG